MLSVKATFHSSVRLYLEHVNRPLLQAEDAIQTDGGAPALANPFWVCTHPGNWKCVGRLPFLMPASDHWLLMEGVLQASLAPEFPDYPLSSCFLFLEEEGGSQGSWNAEETSDLASSRGPFPRIYISRNYLVCGGCVLQWCSYLQAMQEQPL